MEVEDSKTLQDKTRRVGVGCQKEGILRSEAFGILLFIGCLEGLHLSPQEAISVHPCLIWLGQENLLCEVLSWSRNWDHSKPRHALGHVRVGFCYSECYQWKQVFWVS